MKPTVVGTIDAPDWWKMHRVVYSADGIAPCITTKLDHQPNILIPKNSPTLLIRNGTSFQVAEVGDGIKLIYPRSELSCGRVRKGISPTIMAGPVVGVVVKKVSE